MVRVQGEIVIERPPTEVFDFVANGENEPRYNPQMRSAEKITEGPIGVGTSFRAELTGRGRVVPMTIEFTGFERPDRIVESAHMASMDLTGSLTFEPVQGGTRMRWSWDLRPTGAMRFMSPLIGSMGRRSERRVWEGLKRFLEAQAV